MGAGAGALGGLEASFACGPAFVVCAPVMALGGVVIGGALGAGIYGVFGPSSGAQPAAFSGSTAPKVGPVQLGERFDWLGRVDDDDELPKGTMYLAAASVRQVSGTVSASKVVSARVVVEYDEMTRYGELSYTGQTSTDCASETISIYGWETHNGRGGVGTRMRSWSLPPQTVAKPQGALGAVIRAVCRS